MTPVGFATFYEGKAISSKLQEEIDQSVRLYITVIRNRRLNTDFMPLTAITALEFEPILKWI